MSKEQVWITREGYSRVQREFECLCASPIPEYDKKRAEMAIASGEVTLDYVLNFYSKRKRMLKRWLDTAIILD